MTEIVLGSVLLTAIVLVLTAVVTAARRVLLPAKPVSITVNGRENVAAMTGDKLLSALGQAGILVPSACAGAGTCGLCRVTVTGGGGTVLPTETARLSRAELAQGMRLACQVTLRGDVAVALPDSLIGAESLDCTVHSARFLAPFIREFVVALPKDARPALPAGSFFQITAPPYRLQFDELDVPAEHERAWRAVRPLVSESRQSETRAYSISNRLEDSEAGRVVFNIRLALPPPHESEAPPGKVSSYLFSVKPGDRIEIAGPFGSFRAQESDREMVFIGGGVGMAPLRAIILDQLERLGTQRRMSFWYGARNRGELFYAEEFDALAAKHDNFRWTVALSDPRPEDGWQGATGFVHRVVEERLLKDHPAPEDCEYYLCGPPLMIKAVLAMLADAGVEDSAIFNDDFGA
ncbi:NADH:ubiquinone reductase (Na(+)-transporting) subunit F [Defluviimonas sp. WL0024]|uniref:Na(+)-translocating NADH-quinone reductase subunit F n=1 Tax=Albidovulum salinarum TaxID=2984153 RepID=A0ABT2X6X7_9RHOB|nr:NADH:ubiquinone reductase (Na(+)-transporting) subunit F [Defluviimonas sp. WL0024]MCU9847540.1 NADH:ubiquinone reductase (Na(+)-transporting) subunit F [Defluviimonas sp. WL0024]